MKAVYLIIGNCGVGKTWAMKQLISHLGISQSIQAGLYRWSESIQGIAALGVWDGTTFEGSDRLSMGIMADNWLFKEKFTGQIVLADGDRFTNSKFIQQFEPIIVKINGNGEEGRKKRGSNQTQRHLQAIATRVSNITPHFEVSDSAECVSLIIDKINRNDHSKPAITKQNNLSDFLNIEI